MIKSKKGVSPIIATILLILISLVAVAAILAFVVPFVKDYLDRSKECFNIPNQIEILDGSGYTCFNDDGKVGIGVKRSSEDVEISGFKISVQGTNAGGDAKSQVVEIIDGESVTDVYMLNGSVTLSVPGKGEERTYVISLGGVGADTITSVERVLVAPISEKGRLCGVADEVEIPRCLASVIDSWTYLGKGSCVPKTSCDSGECGVIPNGCGTGSVSCPGCGAGEVCNSGTHVCEAITEGS